MISVMKNLNKLESERNTLSRISLTFYEDSLITNDFIEGFKYYLTNNDFIKKQYQTEEEKLKLKIAQNKKQINQLFSLQTTVLDILDQKTNLSSYFILSDPSNIPYRISVLTKENINLEKELVLLTYFEVVEIHTQLNDVSIPMKVLKSSVFSFILIVIVIIIFFLIDNCEICYKKRFHYLNLFSCFFLSMHLIQ